MAERTFRTPQNLCPYCGHRFNACTALSLDSPSKGDLSVCINCGGLLEFCADLSTKALEQSSVINLILKDPKAYGNLMRAQSAVLKLKQRDDRHE